MLKTGSRLRLLALVGVLGCSEALRAPPRRGPQRRRRAAAGGRLCAKKKGYQRGDAVVEEFLGGPEFDALSLKNWRRETLIRYSNANQSEPIRILLFGLLTLSLVGATSIADAIGADKPEGAELAGYFGGGAVSFALFLRERARRNKQLVRLERECDVAELEVRQKVNRAVPGSEKQLALRALQGTQRVLVALVSDKRRFVEQVVAPLQRRLDAARVVVVAVSAAGDDDARIAAGAEYDVVNARAWRKAFDALIVAQAAAQAISDDAAQAPAGEAWFALSFKGRSVGSGIGQPDVSQLLGNLFPPVDILDATPRLGADADAPALQRRQLEFYDALRGGDLAAMEQLFGAGAGLSDAVSAALTGGARLDPWANQLKEGSRPADLLVGDADFCIFGDGAVTTAIEETARGQTLLATQRWARAPGGDEWRLVAHETIPFAAATSANALLRCDARGCVALVK
ncbi:hypothetical protein M885DRAFT_535873 [Pelagophyceae sp. CCMP2097]|nr:hypothetical protein M885DRAFT_535873 [Pelagophyceae sp. CCMP2097]